MSAAKRRAVYLNCSAENYTARERGVSYSLLFKCNMQFSAHIVEVQRAFR